MRLPLLLLGVWCLLLMLAGAAARNAAGADEARAERDAAHARFASIPFEEFTRDRANRMAGRVLDGNGGPISGAEILIFDAQACLDAARTAALGAWPAAAAERIAHSDEAGDYHATDLSYGEKLVVARCAGLRADFLPQIYFADGYGAPDTDFVLRREPAPRVRVVDAGGAAAAGARLRLLPRVFGLDPRDAVCGADGWLTIPPELVCASGLPRALWGEPPVLLELPADGAELALPPCSPLRIELSQGSGGASEIVIAPVGAARVGAMRVSLPAGAAQLDFPHAPHASWVLTAQQEELHASRKLLSGERAITLELAPRRALTLRASGEDGAALSAEFLLQTRAPQDPPVFSSDPLAWSEYHDATMHIVAADETGVARAPAPFAGAGWIVAFAPHHAPQAQPLAAGATQAEFQLAHAHEVAVRTDRPYLPVLVQAAGSPPAFGRTDAAGETFAFAAEGPLVAQAGLSRGGASLPRGILVADGFDPALRFSALDQPGSPRGSLHGFVLTPEGAACANTEVWIQGADGRPNSATTDAHGWYRFTQLETGFYLAFADPQDADALWIQEPVALLAEDAGAGAARLDLTLHAGVLALEPESHGLPAGASVSLRDSEGGALWTGVVPESRKLRLTHVPDGRFTLVEQQDGTLRVLGVVTVRAADGPCERLEVE